MSGTQLFDDIYLSTMAALVPMHVSLLGTRVVFYPSRIHALTFILVTLLDLLVELHAASKVARGLARLCAVMPGAMQLERGGGHSSNQFRLATNQLATAALLTDYGSSWH